MSQNIVLITPSRQFIANKNGLGYQIPLGMVLLGGVLLDSGNCVTLIDNDLYGYQQEELCAVVARTPPDIIMLGHTGSTAAHDTCIVTANALRHAFPHALIVYGGVYPSYAAVDILTHCPAIDVIVRGEGEATAVDLAHTWLAGGNLGMVRGIVWRQGERIYTNPSRKPIQNLDACRPGWELVDWEGYKLFGVGKSAGIQFSRGCPLTCTYCGQWMFWKKWRHRSPKNFVEQLTILARDYGVKIVWLADENFAADRAVTIEVLARLKAANLDLSLNVNMTAADVVRDGDILELYKEAGVDYVVMGIESMDDGIVDKIRKNNPFAVSQEAVRLLRQQDIISLGNIIYGLEDESPRTLWQKFRNMLRLDLDILNAVYLTPHFWTKDGRNTDPKDVIQPDQSKWTYRNQVIATPHLSPTALFLGVKLTEALFHMRPKGLLRLVWGADKRVRTILRSSMAVGVRVVLAEIWEFMFETKFAQQPQSEPESSFAEQILSA